MDILNIVYERLTFYLSQSSSHRTFQFLLLLKVSCTHRLHSFLCTYYAKTCFVPKAPPAFWNNSFHFRFARRVVSTTFSCNQNYRTFRFQSGGISLKSKFPFRSCGTPSSNCCNVLASTDFFNCNITRKSTMPALTAFPKTTFLLLFSSSLDKSSFYASLCDCQGKSKKSKTNYFTGHPTSPGVANPQATARRTTTTSPK